MLEEIRLRYDWAELDNASKQASKEALMKKEGWDTMTWEQQKQMGLMDPFLYAVPTRERTYTGQLQAITPTSYRITGGEKTTFTPLEAVSLGDELSEQTLVEALGPEPVAKPKAKPKAKAKPKPKREPTAKELERQRVKKAAAKLNDSLGEDERELARMLKQQEINCNA
jgi:hypothetical protein